MVRSRSDALVDQHQKSKAVELGLGVVGCCSSNLTTITTTTENPVRPGRTKWCQWHHKPRRERAEFPVLEASHAVAPRRTDLP